MFMTGGAREHLAHLKVSPFTVRVFDSKMSTQIDVPAERGFFFSKRNYFHPTEVRHTHTYTPTSAYLITRLNACTENDDSRTVLEFPLE